MRKHIIVKEEDGKWYDAEGNIICIEINDDEVDYTQILF